MKYFLLAFIISFSVTIWSQSPERLSYQAVVRDLNNQLVTDQAIQIKISIIQGTANGTNVYSEIQNPTTNTNGLISIQIGEGTTSQNFSNINWADGPYFVKTEIDPQGGTNYSISGTSQLLSVPYALHAKTAESVIDLDAKIIELNNKINELLRRIEVLEGGESFTLQDAPTADRVDYNAEFFNLSTPWGYEKSENANRQYPIVVIGRHNESRFFTEDVQKKYPSFYLKYGKSNQSDGVNLEHIIKNIIINDKGYRIDLNRIYLTGWSQGGSGGYSLMRGFHSKGMFFAGMIRIAGQSQTELPLDILEKTSVWYHIGTNDTDTRKQIAESAYAFAKNSAYNSNAIETTNIDTVTDEEDDPPTTYTRTTKTLTNNNIEVFKLSSYQDMWHVAEPPYAHPAVFDWLFKQSLAFR